jgi:hypothetical protein
MIRFCWNHFVQASNFTNRKEINALHDKKDSFN